MGPESHRGAPGCLNHVKEDFAEGKRGKPSSRRHVSGRSRARGCGWRRRRAEQPSGRRGLPPPLGPAAREAIRPRSSARGQAVGAGRASGAAAGGRPEPGAWSPVLRGPARPGPAPRCGAGLSVREAAGGRVWYRVPPDPRLGVRVEFVPADRLPGRRSPRGRARRLAEREPHSPRPRCPPPLPLAHLSRRPSGLHLDRVGG